MQFSLFKYVMKKRGVDLTNSFWGLLIQDCERRALAKLFHHRNEDKQSRSVTTTKEQTTGARRANQ